MQVCFYFQLHQPYRLADYSVLDLGQKHSYFKKGKNDVNRHIFRKVARKSYRPMLRLLLRLLKKYPKFKVAFSCSGIFLEQAEAYDPTVIILLKKLAAFSTVEFLSETYYHSLSSLYSPMEFAAQVKLHATKIEQLFGVTPTTFRNTELIYVNDLATLVEKLHLKGILTEGVPRYLQCRPLTQVFQSTPAPGLPLLLKHSQLSDDIAFRFSNRNWQWYPLTVARYLEWLETYSQAALINLFMDFETFGEHQWADTGIFDFFSDLIQKIHSKKENSFVLPREVFAATTAKHDLPLYDVPEPISWADIDRDLTAWTDNPLQKDCLVKLYALEKPVLASGDNTLIADWRKLQTSDHFYYMCTKWAADGDVHAYFSPYDSPYEAYRRYSIVLADLEERLL